VLIAGGDDAPQPFSPPFRPPAPPPASFPKTQSSKNSLSQ